MDVDDETCFRLRRCLQERLHYDAFRPGQLEAAVAVAKGRDVVVRMGTGGGKSIAQIYASRSV